MAKENPNREMVLKVLDRISGLTAEGIAASAKRLYGYSMTPAQVNGAIRPLVRDGTVGASNYGVGKNSYFLIRRDE